jgi:hypothetical protein
LIVTVVSQEGVASVADFDDKTAFEFVVERVCDNNLESPSATRDSLDDRNVQLAPHLHPGCREGLKAICQGRHSSRDWDRKGIEPAGDLVGGTIKVESHLPKGHSSKEGTDQEQAQISHNFIEQIPNISTLKVPLTLGKTLLPDSTLFSKLSAPSSLINQPLRFQKRFFS